MAAKRAYFITGTDTGVGKTVLAVALTRHLRAGGVEVRAVKPFGSGDRADAEMLREAQDRAVPLADVNPWHYRLPLTPLLAGRREGKRVRMVEVMGYLRRAGSACDVLVVEGAGGLLSPLGEGFSACDLIVALRATAVVVAVNRLGAINQARLGIAALPPRVRRVARVVLTMPRRPDLSSRTNPAMLAELLGPDRVQVLPWLDENQRSGISPPNARLRRALDALVR